MTIYIGLDVHCKWTYYAAGLLGLLESLAAEPGTAAALESGTQAFWASRLLVEAGMEPVVVSAREVRAKARRRAQNLHLPPRAPGIDRSRSMGLASSP